MISTSLPLLSVALGGSIAVMILLTRYARLHAFFSLLISALLFGLVSGQSLPSVLLTLQEGFGQLVGKIGFIVALGSCLGLVLERTGAMESIGHGIVQFMGPKRSLLAISALGVLVGIPVFCDSGFIILSRLVPALAAQTGIAHGSFYLALASGLYTTHTLVPPTPGPLAAAANLQLSGQLGWVIGVGFIVSLPVAWVSYLLSKRLGKRIPNVTESALAGAPTIRNPWLSSLPLVLPVLLISLATVGTLVGGPQLLSLVGHPVAALTLGLVASALLIDTKDRTKWPNWISEALKDAGLILLITGAGGAFGAVIAASPISKLLGEFILDSNAKGAYFLAIAFMLAALLKTAQGSTTSSLIVCSSLIAPLAATAGFQSPLELALLVVALGGGAMTVSHTNDSYFWVVSQFGRIETRTALSTYTLITLAQGLTTLALATILYLLL